MGIWGGKKAQAPTLFASKNHSSFLRNMTSIRRRLFPFQMKWAKDDGVIDRFFRCLSWNGFSGDFFVADWVSMG